MKHIVLILALLVVLSACETEPQSGELARDMVVQTQYDQDWINNMANIFNTYSTFIIREDTLGFVSNRDSRTFLRDADLNISGGYVVPVISRVKTNLSARGYQQVTEDDEPDFAVNIVILEDFNFFQTVTYPGVYSGYWGFYNYYWPIVTSYVSQYTTLVIEIIDIKNATGNQYKVVWNAFIGDLQMTLDVRTKTLEAIDQAFAQSQYILKN